MKNKAGTVCKGKGLGRPCMGWEPVCPHPLGQWAGMGSYVGVMAGKGTGKGPQQGSNTRHKRSSPHNQFQGLGITGDKLHNYYWAGWGRVGKGYGWWVCPLVSKAAWDAWGRSHKELHGETTGKLQVGLAWGKGTHRHGVTCPVQHSTQGGGMGRGKGWAQPQPTTACPCHVCTVIMVQRCGCPPMGRACRPQKSAPGKSWKVVVAGQQ